MRQREICAQTNATKQNQLDIFRDPQSDYKVRVRDLNPSLFYCEFIVDDVILRMTGYGRFVRKLTSLHRKSLFI